MSDNLKVTALLLILSVYYFVASFSFSNLVENEEFYHILNFSRIFLTLILILMVGLFFGFRKKSIILFFVVFVLILLFDPFFTSLAFLLLIATILFNYCAGNSQDKNYRIIKLLNYVVIFSFLSIVSLNKLGVISSNIYAHSATYDFSVRQALGFTNPNQGSIFILQAFYIFYLMRDKIGMIISLCIFLCASIFFISKTSIVSLLFFAIVSLFFLNDRLVGWIKYFFCFMLIVYPMVLIRFIGNGDWIFGKVNLDILFTTRLSGIKLLYETYGGVGFFPKVGDFFVDSGLSNLLVKGGFLLYFLFCWFVLSFVRDSKDKRFLLVFLVYICYCFSENIFNGNLLLPAILLLKFFQDKYSKNLI